MIEFEKFFDAYNIKHIAAYDYLVANGNWPEGFIPKEVSVSHLDWLTAQTKLANAWRDATIFHRDGKISELLK